MAAQDANAHAVAAAFGAPPLLLLDEVTAHLDDDRRDALFAAILDLAGKPPFSLALIDCPSCLLTA